MGNDKIVVGNFKMVMDFDDTIAYVKEFNEKVKSKRVIMCPSSLYLPYFIKHGYSVGIQNICHNDEGSFTGEISANQASSMGINYAIIGHSERRSKFDETNDIVNQKIKQALKYNMGVILCIGETNEEKNLFRTDRVLKKQLVESLKDITVEQLDKIVIAYEPVWAIGTGRVPTNTEIIENAEYIKKVVKKLYDKDIKVLYGGSVNESTIEKLNKIEEISGFLVGGACTKIVEFLKIIEVVVTQ